MIFPCPLCLTFCFALWCKEGVMKVLGCKDLGADCEYTAFGETKDEVLRKISAHGTEHHGMQAATRKELHAWRKKIHEEPMVECCGVYGSE